MIFTGSKEKTKIFTESNQKLPNFSPEYQLIWTDLGKTGVPSSVSLVGLGISGFKEENLPSNRPKSVFGGGDPSPIVTDVGSAGFRVGLGGLGRWVGFQVLMNTPNE